MRDHKQQNTGLTFALQALLSRHETYVAESQQEHERLNAKIAELETDRTNLQSSNEKIVAENRELLAKLDSLNTTYAQSDTTVKNLEALLRDTEIEVRRLTGLARRAEELEARVQDLDQERSDLKQQLDDGEQESRSTLARWRDSERKVRKLELEVERIEWEAKQDREKHEAVVARLERERVIERELGGAEGRLKAAAAVQGMESGNGGNVVSHFVRDILQDNANLQAGIVELRELLQSSNDEVQNLRQQVMHHQPIEQEGAEESLSQSMLLDQQLAWDRPSPDPSQREVHVHHHYHAKLTPKRERTLASRRSTRRRAVMGYGISPMSSTPSTPISRPQRTTSSPIIPLELHQPQAHNRWSTQTTTTLSSNISSIPSSPWSGYGRYGSIFDRIDADEESSRPTSPESAVGLSSPAIKPRIDSFEAVLEDEDEVQENPAMQKQASQVEEQSATELVTPSPELTPKPSQFLSVVSPNPVVAMDQATAGLCIKTPQPFDETLTPQTQLAIPPPSPKTPIPEIRPSLQRSSSHDSLLSISGMDIHLTKPMSALRIKGNQAHFALTPSISTVRALTTSTPVAGITDATAVSSKRSFSSDNQGPAQRGLEKVAGIPSSRPEPPQTASTGLSRLMGGWVSRKWGVAPTKSVADLRSGSASNSRTIQQNTASSPVSIPKITNQRPALHSMGSSMARTPGINQMGAIPGLYAQKAVGSPTKVEIDGQVDEEALRRALKEGSSDSE